MIRLFLTTFLVFSASSSFAADLRNDISKECNSAIKRVTDSSFSSSTVEARSVVEFKIPLRNNSDPRFFASDIDATLSCPKSSKDHMGDSLFLSVEYDKFSVRNHPSMRGATTPDESAMAAMSDLLALTLPLARRDARKMLTSCLNDASRRPTEKFVNFSTDEKTFFTTTKSGITYECTRRSKSNGNLTFLFRADFK